MIGRNLIDVFVWVDETVTEGNKKSLEKNMHKYAGYIYRLAQAKTSIKLNILIINIIY